MQKIRDSPTATGKKTEIRFAQPLLFFHSFFFFFRFSLYFRFVVDPWFRLLLSLALAFDQANRRQELSLVRRRQFRLVTDGRLAFIY